MSNAELPTHLEPLDLLRYQLAVAQEMAAERGRRLAQIECIAAGGSDQRPVRLAEAEVQQAAAHRQQVVGELFPKYQVKEGDQVLPDGSIVRKS